MIFDVVQNLQKYSIQNKGFIRNWIKMYGQKCSVFRIAESETPNVANLRRVYGADKSMVNNSRLKEVAQVYLPITIDELTNCYLSAQYQVEIYLPDESLQGGDIVKFMYHDTMLEFDVQAEVQKQLNNMYKYTLITRSSKQVGG